MKFRVPVTAQTISFISLATCQRQDAQLSSQCFRVRTTQRNAARNSCLAPRIPCLLAKQRSACKQNVTPNDTCGLLSDDALALALVEENRQQEAVESCARATTDALNSHAGRVRKCKKCRKCHANPVGAALGHVEAGLVKTKERLFDSCNDV